MPFRPDDNLRCTSWRSGANSVYNGKARLGRVGQHGDYTMRILLTVSLLALAGCSAECPKAAETAPPPAPPAPISQADAAAFVEKIPTGLIGNDIDGLMTLYADNAVLIDSGTNDVITTKAVNKSVTEGFTKAGFTKLMINNETIQVLDADNFVATSIVSGEMMQNKKPVTTYLRVTDVAHKGADGKWLIVNEHVSMMPNPVKTPLPVAKEFKPPAAAPAPAKPADGKPADTKPATPAKPN